MYGTTGAGKTTTIQLCAGAKMKAKKVNGKIHYEMEPSSVEKLKNPTLIGLAGAGDKSETRFIKNVTVPLRDIGVYDDGVIEFVDAPGYEDTDR